MADNPLDRSRSYIAAAREVREELGIEAAVGPLLVADWAPHPDEGDKLLLVFPSEASS